MFKNPNIYTSTMSFILFLFSISAYKNYNIGYINIDIVIVFLMS